MISGERSLSPNKDLNRIFGAFQNILRRFVYRWVKNRDIRIMSGVGKGLRFNAGYSNPAYSLGNNELPVQQAMAKFLKPGDVFFDVGSNVGFFTVIGSMLVGNTGHVFAFEPAPENLKMVQHNCDLNGFSNVTILNFAVSESTGEANLLLANYSGGATLETFGSPPDSKGTILVKVVSLDDLLYNHHIDPPSVVKIDVEGAEASVLRGMVEVIKQFRPVIIFEVDDQDEESFDRKLSECSEILQSFSYKIVRLEDSYLESDWLVGNFVATPIS